jgi:hypothetical protein
MPATGVSRMSTRTARLSGYPACARRTAPAGSRRDANSFRNESPPPPGPAGGEPRGRQGSSSSQRTARCTPSRSNGSALATS